MHVTTAVGLMIPLVMLLQLSDAAAQTADGLPLPERNPLRVAGMPLPERNPLRIAPEREPQPPQDVARGKRGTWPKVLPGTPAILKTWSEEDTAAERQRCVAILKDVAAEFEPADPVRNGGCGSAAPYNLTRIGSNPAVLIHPPATVTCDMIAAMADWMDEDVQPSALKHLGAAVIRISNISDYSCRNAMSRTSTRLSEHALANALDVRDFITAKDDTADLKRDWGPTVRDIAARIAAEKAAEAARKEAAAAAAAKAAKEASTKAAKSAPGEKGSKMSDAREEVPPAVAVTGSASGAAGGRRLSQAETRRARRDARRIEVASRLGGPAVSAGGGVSEDTRQTVLPAGKSRRSRSRRAAMQEEMRPPSAEANTPRARFLREIHTKACDHFGTVLGPEANEAHRDHFHLDMAKRRHRNFCE